jgi:pectate lyase
MKKSSRVVNVFVSIFVLVSLLSAQPSFPGAEGGGSVSIGGRGGKVIEVTNLNNSGPGSFRQACNTFGARTIIFKVGGTIVLDSAIVITDSYLTIAGQTAPGDGILIRSAPGMKQAPIIFVNSHDIIVRYLRVRPGPYANKQAGDAITVYKTASNIIIDHCSLTWSTDENTEVWVKDKPGKNFTWQWNIISEGLGSHSCGMNSGSNYRNVPDRMTDISVHHNLFSHNGKRSPLMKVKTSDVINNIIYGWKYYPTQLSGGVIVDIIANKYVFQPSVHSGEDRKEIIWKPYNNSAATGPQGNPSIYFVHNIGPHNDNPEATNAWEKMTEMTALTHWGFPEGGQTVIPIEYKRDSRRITSYPITIDNVLDLDSILLAENGIGACMKLDENGKFIPNRDAVDTRIINEYKTKTGKIISETEVLALYPDMQNGIPYTDEDHDGMADVWEVANGLDPTNPNDRNETDRNTEGYTNLELFLNGSDVQTDVFEKKDSQPQQYVLEQNYPNPFNPTTVISFTLPKAGNTNLSVYNVLGEKVITLVNEELSEGSYRFLFDGKELSSGIYFYKLSTDNYSQIKKMLLVK